MQATIGFWLSSWVLELDLEVLREYAPLMAMDIRSLTADQVFDAGYVTWVGFTSEDNVDRSAERERIAAEHAFKDEAQIMVATEAAGEGINLQFCSLMVNYDIPWNPNRLEQRMGQ